MFVEGASALSISPNKVTVTKYGEYLVPITAHGEKDKEVPVEIRIFKNISDAPSEGVLIDKYVLPPSSRKTKKYKLNLQKKGTFYLCVGKYQQESYVRSCGVLTVSQ